MSKTKIYILRGCAGCGKSTYAQKLAKEVNGVVISTDKIREDLNGGYIYREQDNDKVFNTLYSEIRNCCEFSNVIVDATNLMSKDEIYKIYKEYRKDIHIIDVNPQLSLETVLANNQKREKEKVVPDEVVINMYEKWKEVRK